MKKKFIAIALSACLAGTLHAQKTYKYRVYLKDKAGTEFSLDKPEAFLSQKSLERRKRQQLPVTGSDLPVSKPYLDILRENGAALVVTSRWNNTATVQSGDSLLPAKLETLPFVVKVEEVWISPDSVPARDKNRKKAVTNKLEKTANYYGPAYRQIQIHRGDSLHAAGFRGEGMTIAVIDGGFYNADAIKALKNIKLNGTRDFANPASDIYAENNHGMKVLSCMATNQPYVMVGTAPEASYWLLRSEDMDTEQWVEQDYWAAAIEFADSVGADVVNTSLGYQGFDNKKLNYKYRDLDGKHAFISRTAGMAADKGMVVVCSAGNEGGKTWKKITPPGDAENVLTVAAVDSSMVNATFSSVGNTADGRIKPDVAALGLKSAVLDVDGTVSHANGTSFASPTLCGLVTCLWQACPQLTAKELIELVRCSGDRVDYPDNVFGYGIPDVWAAYRKVSEKK